jgi:LysM repeat protein
MSKKSNLLVMFILVLSVLVSACERSASTEPVATPTVGTGASASQEVVPTSNDPMEMLRRFATQTAQALSGTSQPASIVTATPQSSTLQSGTLLPLPTGGISSTPLAIASATSIQNNATAVPPNTVKPANYILQAGEYLFCIARRFNVDQNELTSLNGLSSGGQYVYAGLPLKIPQTGNPFIGVRSLLPRPASYTVASGDSIYSIACKYGDLDPILNIAAANNLVTPYTITTGQILTIP